MEDQALHPQNEVLTRRLLYLQPILSPMFSLIAIQTPLQVSRPRLNRKRDHRPECWSLLV
jgi:hypothetical protein